MARFLSMSKIIGVVAVKHDVHYARHLSPGCKDKVLLSNQCFLSVQTFKTESALRLQALTQGPLSHDIITLNGGPPLTSSFE